MKSVFATLRDDGLFSDLRIARLSGEELQTLESVFERTGIATSSSISGHSSARVYHLRDEGLSVLIEAEPISPSLFTIEGERFTVGFSHSEQVADWIGRNSDVIGGETVGTFGAISAILDAYWKSWDVSCKSRALESVQSDSRFDREGADFFDALEVRLRQLFSPDYLEIAPLIPGNFWADRPDGWSWISATRSDFHWPVPLTSEFEARLLSKPQPHFLHRLDDQRLLLPPPGGSTGLCCGVIFPLVIKNRRHGVLKLLFAREVVLTDSENAALQVVQTGLSEIFDRTSEHLRTQRMAMVDGLTNLFNHRFFLSQLRTEFQRALRYGGTLTLLMIDVDGFKTYNDTYGHQAGNRVLTWVASQIRRTVRDIDVVARYGGEEFALILPEVKAEQGLIVAEKIRKAISQGEVLTDEGERLAAITISCGVADSRGCKGPEEMIDRADRALYWVKRNGRNLVRLASLEG